MFGDKLLRRCFALSLLVNTLLVVWLGRYDLYGPAKVREALRWRAIQVYRPFPHPRPKPRPRPDPGPKLPPPPRPARIRQVVRRVVRPVHRPTPHPRPVHAPVPRPHPARRPPTPVAQAPVATGSHSVRGTLALPPSVGEVGAPTDTISAGGGGDPGEMTTNLSGDGTGLFGEYFQGTDFGKLMLNRADPDIDFNWTDSSPAPQFPPRSAYSARWTGLIQPRYSEVYTFSTLSDDGDRLWIDGREIIDDWQHHKATTHQGTIVLRRGRKYAIRLEYFENGNPPGKIRLWWESASQAREIVPQGQLFPTDAP